jgi:hypothetical protein
MTSFTPNPSTTILLLGAGELGLALLPHLTSLPNTHVTIGVRSPSKHTALHSPNKIDIIHLDLTAPSPTLIGTFSTYSIIVSATGFTSSPSSVTKLASEVLAAGRLRKKRGESELWFFPWQWGVDYDVTSTRPGLHDLMPLFGAQKAVRDLLRAEAVESGVRWTVVSTGVFMSFLFEPFWGVVEREGDDDVVVRCLGDWGHKVTVTDVSDIGRVLARILVRDVDVENKVVYVAGDTISYGELAAVVERVSGCDVQRKKWSVEDLEEDLRKDPEDGIKKYRLVFAGDGVWWEKERTANWELEMPMTDVEMYAKKLFGVRK